MTRPSPLADLSCPPKRPSHSPHPHAHAAPTAGLLRAQEGRPERARAARRAAARAGALRSPPRSRPSTSRPSPNPPTRARRVRRQVRCAYVAAGRHFSVFVGEPVPLMESSDAALLIQNFSRQQAAKREAQERALRAKAAKTLGVAGTQWVARPLVASAAGCRPPSPRGARVSGRPVPSAHRALPPPHVQFTHGRSARLDRNTSSCPRSPPHFMVPPPAAIFCCVQARKTLKAAQENLEAREKEKAAMRMQAIARGRKERSSLDQKRQQARSPAAPASHALASAATSASGASCRATRPPLGCPSPSQQQARRAPSQRHPQIHALLADPPPAPLLPQPAVPAEAAAPPPREKRPAPRPSRTGGGYAPPSGGGGGPRGTAQPRRPHAPPGAPPAPRRGRP